MKKWGGCLGFLLLLAGAGRAQTGMTLLLTDTAGPLFNRNIYGQFAEHLGRCVYDGLFRNGQIRMDVVHALKEAKIPLLRWLVAVLQTITTGGTHPAAKVGGGVGVKIISV